MLLAGQTRQWQMTLHARVNKAFLDSSARECHTDFTWDVGIYGCGPESVDPGECSFAGAFTLRLGNDTVSPMAVVV